MSNHLADTNEQTIIVDSVTKDDLSKERRSINKLFFKRLSEILSIVSKNNLANASALFMLLIAIGNEVVIYYVGLITSRYYVVLGKRDYHGFLMQTLSAVALICLVSLLRSVKLYMAGVISIQWRRLITEKIHSLYFSTNTHYRINVGIGLSSPDQRITEDTRDFAESMSSALPTLLISPFTIAYYSYQLWIVSGYLGPLSIFGYFVVSTIVSRVFMGPVVGRVYEKQRQEGLFRFEHVQSYTHSEQIALQDGENLQHDKLKFRLADLIHSQHSVLFRQFPLNIAVQFTDYIGSIVSFLVLGAAIFSGRYDGVSPEDLSGIISKTTFVAMYLMSCFTQLVDLSGTLANVAGYTHRVGRLFQAMRDVKTDDDEDSCRDTKDVGRGPVFKLDQITMYAPVNGDQSAQLQCLVRNLSIVIDSFTNVLIVGPSNSGKSSLLRLLKGLDSVTSAASALLSDEVQRLMGLHCATEGDIQRCNVEEAMFLPQSPFLEICDLKYGLSAILRVPISADVLTTHDLDLMTEPFSAARSGAKSYFDYMGTALQKKRTILTSTGCNLITKSSQDCYSIDYTIKHLQRKKLINTDAFWFCATKWSNVERRLLSIFHLNHLVSRAGGVRNSLSSEFLQRLSPGEKQRLCMCRVLYHKPRLVFLDEATSAVDETTAMQFYEICTSFGIACVTVTHEVSPALLKFHHSILHLYGDGNWSFELLSGTKHEVSKC